MATGLPSRTNVVVEQLLNACHDSDLFSGAVALAVEKAPDQIAVLDEQIAAAEAAIAHSAAAIDRYYAAFETGELEVRELRGRLDKLQELFDTQGDELLRLQRQRQRSEMVPRQTDLIDIAAATAKIEEALLAPQSWHAK